MLLVIRALLGKSSRFGRPRGCVWTVPEFRPIGYLFLPQCVKTCGEIWSFSSFGILLLACVRLRAASNSSRLGAVR